VPAQSPFAERASALPADADHTQFHARVAPLDGDIAVRKTRIAFSTTDLDEQLRSRGIDTIVLAGISTSGVTLSTVRDAADRDYRVLVLSDATADPDPDVHAFLTAKIFPRQAEVLATDELAAP
jgi:nicotinamidase-related amidase